MPSITQDDIDEIIRQHLSPTNRNPYNREAFQGGMDPHTIYLYCWDHVNTAQPDQQAPRAFKLEYDRPIYNRRVLADRVNEAAQQIFYGQIQPDATGFDGIDYQRKSFIVILLTAPLWYFPEGKAIVFDEGKGQGNHTFFNAFHPVVSVHDNGAERTLPALCFTDWMVDRYGRDLGDGQTESFHYLLFPEKDGRVVLTAIDPGGNNLGPPVPPP